MLTLVTFLVQKRSSGLALGKGISLLCFFEKLVYGLKLTLFLQKNKLFSEKFFFETKNYFIKNPLKIVFKSVKSCVLLISKWDV